MKKERAKEIYLDSISVESGFAPLSFQSLSDRLKDEGIEVSTSTLQRWSVEYKWKEEAANRAKNMSNKEVVKNVSKSQANTIDNIEKIVSTSSDFLLEYVNDVSMRKSKNIKEVELVLKIMVANASLITKPLERQEDGKLSTLSLIEKIREQKDEDFIEAEIE